MSSVNRALEIVPARPADESAVRALLQVAELPDADFAGHLAHFVVARQGGAIVGAVGFELHGCDALLRSLVVTPTAQGQGVAGALLRALEARAREAGVRRWYLLTMTAEAFFARRSFTRIARADVPAALQATPEFQSLCPASAVCLTRELAA